MTVWLLWTLAALAATRWATLITRDEFGPIRQIREWVEYRWPTEDTEFYDSEIVKAEDGTATNKAGVAVIPHGVNSSWIAVDPHPLGTLATCVRCMSVWTGMLAAAVVILVPVPVAVAVFAPFAFSQVAITLVRAD